MDISVVVPTYNRAPLIRETLLSILGQSFPPVQVIVVDDGSTDDTESVVRAIGDSRVSYSRVANAGPAAARKYGVHLARTDWVAFCDSDDLWTERKLELQAELVRCVPELQLVCTNFSIVRDGVWASEAKFSSAPAGYWVDVEPVTEYGWVIRRPVYSDLVRWQWVFWASSALLHTSVFEQIGEIDTQFSRFGSEDFEFALRCGHLPLIGAVHLPVMGYRQHGQNLSGMAVHKRIWDEVRILEYSLRTHPLGARYRDELRREIASRAALVASEAFSDGELARCEEALRRVPWRARSWRLLVKSAIAKLPDSLVRALLRR